MFRLNSRRSGGWNFHSRGLLPVPSRATRGSISLGRVGGRNRDDYIMDGTRTVDICYNLYSRGLGLQGRTPGVLTEWELKMHVSARQG